MFREERHAFLSLGHNLLRTHGNVFHHYCIDSDYDERIAREDATHAFQRACGPHGSDSDFSVCVATWGIPLEHDELIPELVDIIVDQFGGKRKGQGLVGKVKALFK